MRWVYFGTNELGRRVLDWVADRDESPVCTIEDLTSVHQVKAHHADMGVSIGYRHKFTPDIIDAFPDGIVNLHTGFLPWNRGAHPNVWPIIDDSPAGVTLHYVDEGLDTGDIIAQDILRVHDHDTAYTLYQNLETAGVHLFQRVWLTLQHGRVPAHPQSGPGSFSLKSDLRQLDTADLDEISARDLLNQLRARTFPGHKGVTINGTVYRIAAEPAV